jgi:FkbM family methyltransferase
LHIRRRSFITDEPEFSSLETWIKPGDWVVDVGANLGIYTRRMSELVGSAGRVIALEPVPSTFELLAANTADLGNVTLIQAAAVSRRRIVQMVVPLFENGLQCHYRAHVSEEGDLSALGMELADLHIPTPALIKIDAEGHDLDVLLGMEADPPVPVLIVEYNSPDVVRFLTERGYRPQKLGASPNTIWTNEQHTSRSFRAGSTSAENAPSPGASP